MKKNPHARANANFLAANSKTNRDSIKSAKIPQSASFWTRAKAQVIDTFMIYMPIMYIFTYILIGNAASFRQSPWAPSVALLCYALIATFLTSFLGQTPGKKAYGIKIVRERDLGAIATFIESKQTQDSIESKSQENTNSTANAAQNSKIDSIKSKIKQTDSIELVSKTPQIPKLPLYFSFIRFLAFLFSGFCVVGLLLPLWRKDRRALHDILCKTRVLQID